MAVQLRAEPNPFYVHGEAGQKEVAHLNVEARALCCLHLLERNLAAQGGFDRELDLASICLSTKASKARFVDFLHEGGMRR